MPNTIDATLTDTTGPVFVERDGKRIDLNEGDAIYESDVIITGPDTTADILFRDGTKSRLSPDTELKLVDFDFGAGEEPSFVMGLAQGALRTVSGEVVKLNPEAFELITPRATVGIRGTEFFNSVDGINEVHAVLYIADGHIMVVTRPNGDRINLSSPLQLIDITGENPGKLNIHDFSLSEMESLINSLAPSLGDNFPQSESEQGDWEQLTSADAVLDKEEAIAEAAEKTSEEASNTESVSGETTHTATNVAVSVVIVDQNDPNNGVLLDALGQAGITVDIINAGTSDENLDNSLVDDSFIAENDNLDDIRPIDPSLPGAPFYINREIEVSGNREVTLNGANGNDTIIVEAEVNNSGKLTINGVAGDDRITLVDSEIEGDGTLIINGGVGNDTINVDVEVKNSGKLFINGGIGNDTITVDAEASGAGIIVINGGAGDDRITIENFDTYAGGITITGGAGQDSFYLNIGDSKGTLVFTDFNSSDGNITLDEDEGFKDNFHYFRGDGNDLTIWGDNEDGKRVTFIFEDLLAGFSSAQDAYDSISGQLVGFGGGVLDP